MATKKASNKNQPRILLTGGGSGGHIFPLAAITEELQLKANVTIVIEKGDAIARQAFDKLEVAIHEISAGKLRRYHGRARWYIFHPVNIRENVRDAGRLTKGVVGALRLLRRLRPDVVFVKGGYVGLPIGIAAAYLKIPIVTHDSDALPGLTNRLVSRWAHKIAVGFPREHYQHYPSYKLVQVGIPVRAAFSDKQAETKPRRPQILIIGGSLGARAINQAVLAVGKKLLSVGDIQHIAGQTNFEAINDLTESWRQTGHYTVHGFVGTDYMRVLRRSSVVITRAGATSIAECAAAGVPMIVIPNPYLTGGHQINNALVLEDESAGIVISENDLTHRPEVLVEIVTELLGDIKKQAWLIKNAHSLFPSDASRRIADLLIEVTKVKS